MEKLFLSLAYKYVMLTLMLAEANHALQKLDVPDVSPITMTNVVSHHITPPRMRAGGSLDTTNLMFGFGENQLQFIQFAEPNSDLDLPERQQHWSKMKSLIDTNGAYQLATNWLVQLDVDVNALEKTHPPSVMQQFFHPSGDLTKKIMLPRFEVRWGTNPSLSAVWVSIFGPTKSPIHIRQENGSFIRRPELIKKESIEKLLSITDQYFAGWSVGQKSNLVVRSTGIAYSALALPEIVSKSELDKIPHKQMPVQSLNPKKGEISPKRTKTIPPRSKLQPPKVNAKP